MTRPIAFLSDFGLADEFVGVCKAVIVGIAPDANVIDLSHEVAPHDALDAALTLSRAAPYLPRDAVVLVVVDPGVGTGRRPVAVQTERGPILVGPDNGVLSLACEELGGVRRAVEITNADLMVQPVSATFHGRDVFAPVAAHLAAEQPLEAVGPDVPPGDLGRVHLPAPLVTDGRIEARVLSVDRFGNVQLNVRAEHLRGLGSPETLLTGPFTLRRVVTFAQIGSGELAYLLDSSGWVAVAANGGSAAVALGVARGGTVILDAPAAPAT